METSAAGSKLTSCHLFKRLFRLMFRTLS